MANMDDLLTIAVRAVDRGACLVRTRVPGQLTAKGDRDYASDVDFEIERDLQVFLADATPDIGFLGEEGGMVRVGRRHWALDPIDGTVNFANALPLCAVSLALIEDDRPVLGVIRLPFLDQTYTAVQGQGAFRDDRRLSVAAPARLRGTIVSIGDYAVGVGAEAKNADRLAITRALAGEVLRRRAAGPGPEGDLSRGQGRHHDVSVLEHTGILTASDGRVIAWMDGGDLDGYPVMGLHGTPGCRLSRWSDDSVYAEAGVRYVTTDRAGYGLSTRHRGRSVADEVRDVLAVAEALGFDRFAVVGGSGGGPHALACAALLPERVERVACQSSLAPLGDRGLSRARWLEGMEEEIAAELAWAEAGEDVLTGEMERAQRLMERRLAEDPGALMGEGAPPGDVEFLRRPEVVANFHRIIAEQARNGVGGAVDDTIAFAEDWGFNLADITVPVLLTYGDADTSCPVAHGRFLAKVIPTAIVVETAGGGHLPTDPRNEILATHRWLRTGVL